jgi:hypothetical protein
VKVTGVTTPDAAADVLHPDHPRWVKERTLAMEVTHAQRSGGTFRDAEAENTRLLARMEQLARAEKPAPTVTRPDREERHRERGVFTRAPTPRLPGSELSPCGRCGTCRRCKREKRVYAMILKARAGDKRFEAAVKRLGYLAIAAQNGTGMFAAMKPADANRYIIRRTEDICDASVPSLGEWR